MTEEQIRLLRSCATDEKAFEVLKNMFKEIHSSCEIVEKNLWLLEQAIKNDYDSILITDLQMHEGGPQIVYVNDGFTKMTGYTRDEVIGKTPRILQGPKTDRNTLENLKKSLVEGHSFFGQAINYRKDGSEFINQWDIHPIYNENNELTNWVSYQHDITAKKRAEATYVEQNAEYDTMDELSKRTLVDFDPIGRIIYGNKAFRALTGYEKEELARMSIWDLICRRHAHSLKARFNQNGGANELDGTSIKTVITHKSGLRIQVEIRCQEHELTEGKLIRACINNLTQQKRILKTLTKRNLNFTNLVEKNSDFTYKLKADHDSGLHYEWVSDAFKRVTGHDNDKPLQPSGWVELIHPDDIDVVYEHIYNVMAGKSTVIEYRIRAADGTVIRVIDYGKPVIDLHTGKVLSVSGAIMDVTKVRQHV